MKTTWWDVKNPNSNAYQIRRWLSQIPHGGIVGNRAVLIVYNEKHPERSEMIVEELKS